MAVFHIAHLYPEELNIGGDRGNILCLEKRLTWRGIDCRVSQITPGDEASFTDVDLLYVGGGEEFDESVLLEDLQRGRGKELCAAIEDGLPVLAISGGMQFLGKERIKADGTVTPLLGALDVSTVIGETWMLGNYIFQTEEESGATEVVGFENHFGILKPGSNVRPLGTVVKGFGNNGEDKTEGVRYKNVFGSHAHGPILPKNPAFCDHLLKTALEKKFGQFDLELLDDTYEMLAHGTIRERILAGTDSRDE